MPGRWPPGAPLTWYFDPANLTDADAALCAPVVGAAVESWSAVCGAAIARTADPSAARLVVRFLFDLGPEFDATARARWQAGTMLGLTDEPVGADATTQLVMRLNANAAARWDAPKLDEAARHEAGHFLGIGHAPDGVVSCMSAYLNQLVPDQQPWEVGQAQALYGPPPAPPAPPAQYAPQPLATISPPDAPLKSTPEPDTITTPAPAAPPSQPGARPVQNLLVTLFAGSISKLSAAVVGPILLHAIQAVPADQVVSFVLNHAHVAALPADEQADISDLVHAAVSFAAHFAAHRLTGK